MPLKVIIFYCKKISLLIFKLGLKLLIKKYLLDDLLKSQGYATGAVHELRRSAHLGNYLEELLETMPVRKVSKLQRRPLLNQTF